MWACVHVTSMFGQLFGRENEREREREHCRRRTSSYFRAAMNARARSLSKAARAAPAETDFAATLNSAIDRRGLRVGRQWHQRERGRAYGMWARAHARCKQLAVPLEGVDEGGDEARRGKLPHRFLRPTPTPKRGNAHIHTVSAGGGLAGGASLGGTSMQRSLRRAGRCERSACLQLCLRLASGKLLEHPLLRRKKQN